jgi:protein involved in polysaccharide export with SLBB domain
MLTAFAFTSAAIGCASKRAEPDYGNLAVESHQVEPTAPGSKEASESEKQSSNVALDYVLQPGDVIDIRFFYNAELNETLPIRPDGKISLVLIGEQPAAGMSTEEFRQSLQRAYTNVLRQPEITVIVKDFGGQKVYVGGEVLMPGLQLMNSPMTALQAIFQAGGFKRSSDTRQIVILRNQGTPEPAFISVDLKDTLKGTALDSDIVLQASDIVFVPKTKSAKFNEFVKQYITELVPITLVLGLNYLFGNTVVVP